MPFIFYLTAEAYLSENMFYFITALHFATLLALTHSPTPVTSAVSSVISFLSLKIFLLIE